MQTHIPVMLHEVIDYISPNHKLCVDGTGGHGGHTKAIAKKMQNNNGQVWYLDRDKSMLPIAKEKLQNFNNINFYHISYTKIADIVVENSQKVDFVLLDLGINRGHIRDGSRGFSFQNDGPLDMRFDQTTGFSAYELLKRISHNEMIDKLMQYGDFNPKRAETITFLISKNRNNDLLKTTNGLVKILKQIKMGKPEITRFFQAIRILTNGELDGISIFLSQLDDILNIGGRLVIMSYHSGEDRLVKNAFKKYGKGGNYKILTPKPLIPTNSEIRRNAASRSVKVRVIERIDMIN